MNIVAKLFLSLTFILTGWLSAYAQNQNRGTPAEAIAMVKSVKRMFHQVGAEKTIKAVNARSHGFRKRDLYPFIVHVDGWMAAHFFPPIRGLNIKRLEGARESTTDLGEKKGVDLFKEWMRVLRSPAKKGWVNYIYFNPVTKKNEDKSSYMEWLGRDFFVGVGVYGKVQNVASRR